MIVTNVCADRVFYHVTTTFRMFSGTFPALGRSTDLYLGVVEVDEHR